jgi:acyl-coenzyme A synthetase/AMP-(fatty) acid ligase
MGEPATPFGGAVAGTPLGPLRVTVSAAANERYWASAGVDHAALRSGALYPPIAANLTILLFQTVATRPLLHTAQRLVAHRRGVAGTELTVSGTVTDRYEKRGREYAVVDAVATLPDGEPLWSSTATFCEQ